MNMALRQTGLRMISSSPVGGRGPAAHGQSRPRTFIVVDGQAMVRHGMAMALQAGHPGSSAHQAADLDTAVRLASRLAPPDLLVVDADALVDGAEAGLHRLAQAFGPVPVLVISSVPDAGVARACLTAGARAFLLKSDSGAVLEHSVALILSGEGYVPLPAWMLRTHRPAPKPTAAPDAALGRLTGRQREIFSLLLSGYSNKEIARNLGVLEGTVKVHVRAMMQKLGATNRTQVAVMAARCGLRAGQ